MHKRLLLMLGLVLAVGATPLVKGQDGMSSLDQDKKIERDSKPDKAKKNNDGHRKHWWSLPHFRHKKQQSDSAARPAATNSSTKMVAVKPADRTGTPTKQAGKTASVTRPGQKRIARTGQGAKSASRTNARRKTVASAGQGKKTVRHNCSPEQARKGGCQAAKGHSAKGTSPS